MNHILLNFEKHYALGPTFAAQLLGIAYPTYAAYRSGARELPLCRQRHVESLMLHNAEQRKQLIEEHVHVTRKRR